METIEIVAWALVAMPLVLAVYAYALYPLLLLLLTQLRSAPGAPVGEPGEWPEISISLAAYNEAKRIRGALDAILAADYPVEKRQVLVTSDASTDATDRLVREYGDRGVDLLRLEERGGKTAAENEAASHLQGSIVVNTDASVRIHPDALKALVRAFQDQAVGVTSGRDVSVGSHRIETNRPESAYVGYEMWVRAQETRLGSIVGASGSLYAIRRELHEKPLPANLSRDFAAALRAREAGYSALSVNEALCQVPRTAALRSEYRRKVRTMARGLETLWYMRPLLNPVRYGLFAWMLFSHKLCRWLVPLAVPASIVALMFLSGSPITRVLLLAVVIVAAGGTLAWAWPEARRIPRALALVGYLVVASAAGVAAWLQVLVGRSSAFWEPTRRE